MTQPSAYPPAPAVSPVSQNPSITPLVQLPTSHPKYLKLSQLPCPRPRCCHLEPIYPTRQSSSPDVQSLQSPGHRSPQAEIYAMAPSLGISRARQAITSSKARMAGGDVWGLVIRRSVYLALQDRPGRSQGGQTDCSSPSCGQFPSPRCQRKSGCNLL